MTGDAIKSPQKQVTPKPTAKQGVRGEDTLGDECKYDKILSALITAKTIFPDQFEAVMKAPYNRRDGMEANVTLARELVKEVLMDEDAGASTANYRRAIKYLKETA